MKSKHQEIISKLTSQVISITTALNEAIREQVKQAELSKFRDGKYTKILSDKLGYVYLSNINMNLLEEMEKPLDNPYSHIFNPYKREQLQLEQRLACGSEDSKHESKIINQYFSYSFEKKAQLMLRENFLINLIQKSITPEGIEAGLSDFIFNEALNIKSFIEPNLNFGQDIISIRVDFRLVVRKFKETINEKELSTEAKALVNTYTDLAGTINAFQSCSTGSKYAFKKDQEVSAALLEVDNIKNVRSLNQLFVLSELYVNKHKNPIRDFILGINKTKSWQSVAEKIRTQAYKCLLTEVDRIEDFDEKIDYLRKAKLLPVFKDHRYNYIITGAFFRTATLKKIDGLIEHYIDQRNKIGLEYRNNSSRLSNF